MGKTKKTAAPLTGKTITDAQIATLTPALKARGEFRPFHAGEIEIATGEGEYRDGARSWAAQVYNRLAAAGAFVVEA